MILDILESDFALESVDKDSTSVDSMLKVIL